MKVLRADFRKIEALVYTKYLSCMAFTSHDIVSSTKTETTSQSPAGFVFLVTQNCLSMEFFFSRFIFCALGSTSGLFEHENMTTTY